VGHRACLDAVEYTKTIVSAGNRTRGVQSAACRYRNSAILNPILNGSDDKILGQICLHACMYRIDINSWTLTTDKSVRLFRGVSLSHQIHKYENK
jgi:hypothetical protein